MIPMTVAEIAEATSGRPVGVAEDVVVTGPVVVDSRQAAPGALFVAVAGEHVDGHDFAAAAVKAGAVAVLGARATGVPTVVVPDPVPALGSLAAHVRRRLTATTVVGVTGSSGKTTTKDLLAQVLGTLGPTVYPEGSFNNEIGLPLTLCRAEESTRFLVLEMGARGVGHIAALCAVAAPTVGVVLNVGSAHVGEFGSQDAIAAAKSELVAALPPEGVAVLNADDPRVLAMSARTPASVLTVGLADDVDVAAREVTLDDLGRARFTLVTPGGRARVALRSHGEHQVPNALEAGGARGLHQHDVARTQLGVQERECGIGVGHERRLLRPA
ncbi:MAG: UDP-N-acetylmuramoyl-tripeptide--D-alanyl-D-alanine ligase, partial [Actinomycetota bacterium]|nr:UDP-N-acetylmuramoyl-tripeptide--D-alanyl-D-alanine ligase [Actinomycetota bacterium]